MRSVKMNRVELLEIVKNNLIKHALDYEKAVNGYKVAALKISTENLKLAKSGDLWAVSSIQMPLKSLEKEWVLNLILVNLEGPCWQLN